MNGNEIDTRNEMVCQTSKTARAIDLGERNLGMTEDAIATGMTVGRGKGNGGRLDAVGESATISGGRSIVARSPGVAAELLSSLLSSDEPNGPLVPLRCTCFRDAPIIKF
jgi:hypothetical protein